MGVVDGDDDGDGGLVGKFLAAPWQRRPRRFLARDTIAADGWPATAQSTACETTAMDEDDDYFDMRGRIGTAPIPKKRHREPSKDDDVNKGGYVSSSSSCAPTVLSTSR